MSGTREAPGRMRLPAEDATVHGRFAEVVRATPDAPALDAGGTVVSYAELDQRTRRLAARLASPELGRRPVAVLTTDGAEFTEAVLAVARAGGFYLPLDPTLPSDRLTGLLRTADPAAVLASAEHMAVLDGPGIAPTRVVAFRDDDAAPAHEDVAVDSAAPVLLGFTSGSTGEPKGLLRTHRSELFGWTYQPDIEIGPGDRVGYIFGGATPGAMGSPLRGVLNGARLCTYDLRRRGFNGLGAWLRDLSITVVQFAPSVLRHFVESLAPDDAFPDLRVLFLGGEPLFWEDVARVRPYLSPAALVINRFGASETGLVGQYSIPGEMPIGSGAVPLGRPLGDVEVHLADDAGLAVADGTPGNAIVRTRYAAKGHWRRPDLDVEVFHRDPDDPSLVEVHLGDRMVRTADGILVHAGRRDDTILVSGHRVSMTEVEMALSQLPGVRECAATVHEDTAGFDRLVGYVVPARRPAPSPHDLRRSLATTLPDHALPSRIVLMDRLPLLTSGKVDRDALPAPQVVVEDGAEPATRDAVEARLAAIWERVLGVERVGSRDAFFDLGGDSVRAARMFAELQREFGVDWPLTTLIDAPTVATLAQLIRERRGSDWPILVPVQTKGDRPPLFVIHGKGGNIVSARHLAAHLGTDQPIYGLQSEGLSGRTDVATTIEEMATRYLARIQAVAPDGPLVIFGQSFGGVVAFEMGRRLLDRGRSGVVVILGDTKLRTRPGVPSPPTTPRGRLRLHWANLGRYHGREKLSYVRRRAYARLRQRLWPLAVWFASTTGRRVPRGLRSLYVEHLNVRAFGRYQPRPGYVGEVVLLRARDDEPSRDLGWSRFVSSGLRIVEVDVEHHDIIREPHVRHTATMIRDEVDRLRSRHP